MPRVAADCCLNCDYSLAGLPPRHRCPECGQAYDEHIRVWKPARPRRLMFASLGFVFGLVWIVPNLARIVATPSAPVVQRVAWMAAPCVLALVLARAVHVVVRTRRKGFRVTFSAAGVGVRGAGPEILVDWTRVVRMRRSERYAYRTARLSAHLERADGPPIPIIYFFDTDRELDEFVQEFETARRYYLSQLAQAAPDTEAAP